MKAPEIYTDTGNLAGHYHNEMHCPHRESEEKSQPDAFRNCKVAPRKQCILVNLWCLNLFLEYVVLIAIQYLSQHY